MVYVQQLGSFQHLVFQNILNTLDIKIIVQLLVQVLYKALTGSNNEIQVNKVFWHKTRFIHAFLFLLAY